MALPPNKLSPAYQAKLLTCHEDLQRLVAALSLKTAVCVVYGHRTKEDQEKAVDEGKSRLHWPNSKHNAFPSLAVDLAPLPINWLDYKAFQRFAVLVKETAAELGVKVEWGGDWKAFKDLPHWQIQGGEGEG